MKPVIAYIHGGAFFRGSGHSYFVGPEYIMDRDVVLVAINYRLGALGFFSTGTADAPGNAGMKDQVLALKWIQRNIRAFGGDPDSVTIAGQSAGSMSVTLHLLSPMSVGLFHKAIALSGSMASQMKIKRNNTEIINILAESANCTNADVSKVVECLQQLPVQAIIRPDIFQDICLALVWYPVIENDLGHTRFLTGNPSVLFKKGNFTKVPVITGIVDNEFASPAKCEYFWLF